MCALDRPDRLVIRPPQPAGPEDLQTTRPSVKWSRRRRLKWASSRKSLYNSKAPELGASDSSKNGTEDAPKLSRTSFSVPARDQPSDDRSARAELHLTKTRARTSLTHVAPKTRTACLERPHGDIICTLLLFPPGGGLG
eukprot:3394043-Prymnesium_polylepis.1